MSSDAVMNVSFKNLYNKRKIWLDNRGGSAKILSGGFGPAIGDSRGRNDSFIWEGHIEDPDPSANRCNYQWVVFRRWIMNSKIGVVNGNNTGYDQVLISWETPGGAYDELNPPSYFRIHFSAAAGPRKVITTDTPEVDPGVVLPEEGPGGGHMSRCVAIAPYVAYGGCEHWIGATAPSPGGQQAAGSAAVPEAQFNYGIGGKLMDTWEEGILCADFFHRRWRYEVRGETGAQLGITCRNLADTQRSSHLGYGQLALPGVAVSWIAEMDVYDVLPEATEKYNPNGELPDRKNIPRY